MTIAVRATALLLLLVGAAGRLAAHEPDADRPPEPSATPRPLAIDDYFRLGDVDDPRISPDGRWVAYTVTVRDLEEDEERTRIWMAPAAGGDARPMTAEDCSSKRPRWSPDGNYLGFLSARDEGKTQVWTLFRQGGEAVQRTDTAQGVQAFEWSPDGRRMVLVIQDPTPRELEEHERREAGLELIKEKTPPPWVVDRRQFKEDYVGYLDRRRTHLYVLEVESGELSQITAGDYDDSEPAWSPDGRLIAFTSNRTADPDANYDTDVWVVAADSPDQGGTLLEVTDNPGPDQSPAWSPDGKWIAHVSATDVDAIVYATYHLGVSSSRGGDTRMLTAEIDRWVGDPMFSPDGRWLYFELEDSGERALARLPAGATSSAKLERVIGGPRTVSAFDLGPEGAVAALISEPLLPPEVFMLRRGGPERLTRVNDELLAEVRLGEVENVGFESPDGTPIEGFVVKPPGFDPGFRYPAILLIHGGPVAQHEFAFDFEPQLFAANGYVVLLPNPRGSSGYGQEFSMGIWQKWGETDYEDVIASVDDAIARGYADPERLGVAGWSYGGMLTNHVITKTDRFKAAITGASATLYVVNYGHDQYQRWWEYELGLPWESDSRELWEKLSPFNRVEKVVTPTLIVGGEKDWNVPIINSEQLFLALKRLGRTAELVVYPGEYHGIDTPTHQQDLFQRYLAWWAEYLKP